MSLSDTAPCGHPHYLVGRCKTNACPNAYPSVVPHELSMTGLGSEPHFDPFGDDEEFDDYPWVPVLAGTAGVAFFAGVVLMMVLTR